MSDLLLINLGMGNTRIFGPLGYAETEYLFDDGSSYTTHLAGLALWKWLSGHEMDPLSVCFAATEEVWTEEKEKLVREEGVHSILLCPGFTHRDVAEIAEAVGKNVGVFVARGDGPSHRITMEVMKMEGWFKS